MSPETPSHAAAPLACVIGWPAKHSRSPMIHRYWLKRYGLSGDYEIAEISPEHFDPFLRGLRENGYVGGNVTVPHKVAAARIVREVDETAAALGAVNTVWYENGDLVGANTDVYGFLANLDAAVPDWQAGVDRAVVLGAGGAARGIVHGLMSRGVDRIDVVNRTVEKAEALRGDFGNRVAAFSMDTLPARLAGARLLVNTTSLGMAGAAPLDIDLAPLTGDAVVSDIVYVPLQTALLKQAEDRGFRTVDGLGMLLHQAVPGFEKWFGRQPEVTGDLRALIIADLEAA